MPRYGRINNLLKERFQFFFMLLMFGFNPVVKIYCVKFLFLNIKIIHEIKTVGKKPGQTYAMC